jgi:hypothetical protein
LVVSTVVVVPDFTTGNRISDGKIQGFLLRPGKNVRKLDCKHKPVENTVWEGLLVAGGDFRYRLPLVKGEAHRNPFFECEIAHTDDAFNRGPNQLDVLDDNITRIFSWGWGYRHVDTVHDERTLFKIVTAGVDDRRGKLRLGPTGIR